MHNSFKATQDNRFDRNFGGTDKGTADPYVSGYHFIFFKKLPPELETIIKHDINDLGIQNIPQIQRILSASCLSVTPPGGTLNSTEFTGLGGTKWGAPTNFDYGNSLTIRFLEFSRLPILHIFSSWFRLIREYRSGTSPLGTTATSQYTKQAYASTILYWTTKPDGKTVEFSACYTGCYPTKDPMDSYPGDLTAVDKLEIDMEFRLDRIWKEPWVRAECQTWADTFKSENDSYRGNALGNSGVAGSSEEQSGQG